MGYRSTVGIMFKRDDQDAPSMPEVLALAKTKGIWEGDKLGGHWNDDYGWSDDKFLFYVEDVKWYDTYPDVQLMEDLYSFVEELSIESGGWYSGMFLRIGEQDDDVEQKTFGGSPWDDMWLVRAVEFHDAELLGNQAKQEETQPETS